MKGGFIDVPTSKSTTVRAGDEQECICLHTLIYVPPLSSFDFKKCSLEARNESLTPLSSMLGPKLSINSDEIRSLKDRFVIL